MPQYIKNMKELVTMIKIACKYSTVALCGLNSERKNKKNIYKCTHRIFYQSLHLSSSMHFVKEEEENTSFFVYWIHTKWIFVWIHFRIIRRDSFRNSFSVEFLCIFRLYLFICFFRWIR